MSSRANEAAREDRGMAACPNGPVRAPALAGLVLSCSLAVQWACGMAGLPASALPPSLGDDEFWSLTAALSEAPGAFEHSENLVSNERRVVDIARLLRPAGGVYIGVGPEQNYSYIARLRPAMAFIVDIRHENRNLHLMYKALFELSADRAEFLSRLFGRERPPGIGTGTPVRELFRRYAEARPDRQLSAATSRRILERLAVTHRFPLSTQDLDWIGYALSAFHADGPEIHYARSRQHDTPGPSFRELMTSRDVTGESRSFLAADEAFAFVKQLHAKNLIVPVVGDFGGADALRRVGDYVRRHDGIVSAFYGSNVEVYLNRQQMQAFCRNLEALPYRSSTRFIGGRGIQPFRSKLDSCAPALR